ncbi:hypothetical protein ABZ589_06690 [Streptomyces sp. NPDC013313]|uniref:hypothetical protein n=1 Tax=Streptomyces sp. NPDC013313 TaxID=3155603 RepID=UPI0033F6A806
MAELITNSVVYGAGLGTVRIRAESDRIVCEVHDGGLARHRITAEPRINHPGERYRSTSSPPLTGT